nr:MAG: replication initiator protein [Microvirus sp.]
MPCITPLKIKNKRKTSSDYAYNVVPCGKCPQCQQKRVNSWIFRLLQEEKRHVTALFVTLTYTPENAPRSDAGLLTLSKSDCQNFLKRLRKNTGCKTIKYYLAGEYGGQTRRPHYHAIMFDVTEQQILENWQHGAIHVGNVTQQSIGYCAKYINKGKIIPMWNGDDRVPEFSLMSKKMGANYLTPQQIKYHKDGKRNYVTTHGGHKQSLPRYYRDKIFEEHEIEYFGNLNKEIRENQYVDEVNRAGSEQNYHRIRFERIRSAIKSNQLNAKNRNKI